VDGAVSADYHERVRRRFGGSTDRKAFQISPQAEHRQ
jgi:hypothetical protein